MNSRLSCVFLVKEQVVFEMNGHFLYSKAFILLEPLLCHIKKKPKIDFNPSIINMIVGESLGLRVNFFKCTVSVAKIMTN